MQKRQGIIYVFLVFLAVSVVVFLFFKLPFLKPVSSLTQAIFSPITSTIHSFFSFGQNQQVKTLQQENMYLSKRLVDQAKLLADNKALRDQFAVSIPKSENLVAANIVGSPSFVPGVTLPENYILDKGQRDGVKIGQAVIYKDNLVGKIISVSYGFSKVELLTNSSFSITSQTLQTNSLGVAKGQGGGEIILDNVLLSQNLKQDDLVITKGDVGTNGVGFLPNLILGKIISINKNPSDLFQTAKIKTLLDFTKLFSVFIVKSL